MYADEQYVSYVHYGCAGEAILTSLLSTEDNCVLRCRLGVNEL